VAKLSLASHQVNTRHSAATLLAANKCCGSPQLPAMLFCCGSQPAWACVPHLVAHQQPLLYASECCFMLLQLRVHTVDGMAGCKVLLNEFKKVLITHPLAATSVQAHSRATCIQRVTAKCGVQFQTIWRRMWKVATC